MAAIGHLRSVAKIDVSHLEIDDNDLRQLGGFTTSLRELDLSQTPITGEGLKYLENLQALESLELWDNPGFTDAGLSHLKGMKSLKHLMLQSTPVTDSGMAYLKDYTALGWLNLRDTQITDAGMVYLEGLTNLRMLSLSGTKVSDAGMVHLKNMTSMQVLELMSTKVSGPGLVYLKGMTNLRELSIAGTPLTDAGLMQLKNLTSLTRIFCSSSTNITGKGVEELQKALPNCIIDWRGRARNKLMQLQALTASRSLRLNGTGATDVLELQRALTRCVIYHD